MCSRTRAASARPIATARELAEQRLVEAVVARHERQHGPVVAQEHERLDDLPDARADGGGGLDGGARRVGRLDDVALETRGVAGRCARARASWVRRAAVVIARHSGRTAAGRASGGARQRVGVLGGEDDLERGDDRGVELRAGAAAQLGQRVLGRLRAPA